MRPLLGLFALGAFAASPLASQRSWAPEVGVRGGFVRFKLTGTAAADHSDLVDVPGFGSGYGSLFAVIPIGARVAVEPSIAFTQVELGDPTFIFLSNTNVDLGLRANYALTTHVFAAVGGALIFSESSGQHDMQLGVQAAVGYRTSISDRLATRIEAQIISHARGGNDLFQPANVYAVLVGFSARARSAPRPPASGPGFWTPALGVAGGYSRAHLSGFGTAIDFTLFSAPGSVAAAGIPAPPSMFAIIPLTNRLALEPGFDVHRTQSSGTTSFTGLFSARLDYAVGAHWYAAAGPAMQVVKSTGSSAFGIAGLGLAWGTRFAVAGDLGGRVELGYAMFKERSGSPFAVNTFGVLFGATMPLH